MHASILRRLILSIIAAMALAASSTSEAQHVASSDEQALSLARELVTSFEGFREYVYADAGGVATVGWGHTDATGCGPPIVTLSGRITEAMGEAYLACDLAVTASAVDRLVTSQLFPEQKAALISFAFNVGTRKLEQSTLLKHDNAGRFDAAADELLRWVLCDGKRLRGLIERRRIERQVWMRGSRLPPS